jgi:hypothetical protein
MWKRKKEILMERMRFLLVSAGRIDSGFHLG